MKNIPFKIQPRDELVEVGDDTCGIIEFPKKNGLTVGEKMTVESVEDTLNYQTRAAKLSKEIADNHEVSLTFAWQVVTSDNWEEIQWEESPTLQKLQGLKKNLMASCPDHNGEINKAMASLIKAAKSMNVDAKTSEIKEKADKFDELRLEYTEEITSLMNDLLQSSLYKKRVAVTAIMKNRLNADWTEEDTLTLDEKLYNAIWEFTLKEMNGWEEPVVMPDVPTEDEIKNLPTETPALVATN